MINGIYLKDIFVECEEEMEGVLVVYKSPVQWSHQSHYFSFP